MRRKAPARYHATALAAAAALASAAALTLGGCSGDDGPDGPAAVRTAMSPAFSPTGGGSVENCPDGGCKVEVRAGDVVRFENEPSLDGLLVAEVSSTWVSFRPSVQGVVESPVTVSLGEAASIDTIYIDILELDGGRATVRFH